MEWIKQLIDGEEYPYGKTLNLNHNDRHKDLVGYFRFLQATSAWQKGIPSILEPEAWGNGANCTLYLFNNVSGGDADSKLLNPQREGNLRLQFRLNAGLGHIATVIVYGEFENVMEITQHSGVLYGI